MLDETVIGSYVSKLMRLDKDKVRKIAVLYLPFFFICEQAVPANEQPVFMYCNTATRKKKIKLSALPYRLKR